VVAVYLNAQNEAWLDFTTDAQGNAQSSAEVSWDFRKGEANSLIIHAQHTMTEPARAGTEGARAGCITIPL